MAKSYWSGKEKPEFPVLTDEELEEEHAKAVSKLRSMYERGVPFFTKEAIRDVYRQIQEPLKRGDKITVKCLDGEPVDFNVEVGRTYPSDRFAYGAEQKPDPQLEFILQAPCIDYLPMQALTESNPFLRQHLMYCNLVIEHPAVLRDKTTQESVKEMPDAVTEQTVRERFESTLQAWETSNACKQLRSTLGSAKVAPDTDKVVGFALSTMCQSISDYEDRYERGVLRSSFQHALLLTIRDVLAQKGGRRPEEIECYVQDPLYTSIDISTLKGYGITVLGNPEGFLKVDDSTAVISISPNVPVQQIVSDLARPPLIIWNTVDEEHWPRTDPITPRIKKTITNSYDTFEFLGDDEHFGDLSVYVRQSSSQADVAGRREAGLPPYVRSKKNGKDGKLRIK